MLKAGLVSITFRDLPAEAIIEASVKAGIAGIEWGGDIHVPHGDLKTAGEINRKTTMANLEVAAYGSYYRFDSDPLPFNDICNTAKALGAPLIRVWAGLKGSKDADSYYYNRIVNEAKIAGELCRHTGIDLAFEYHKGTLTDTNESAHRFIADIGHPSVFSYWQPPIGMDKYNCLEGIKLLGNMLKWVHVFHWDSKAETRYNLEEGIERWKIYIQKISQIKGDHWCLLEFVKDNTLKNFYKDAKTLLNLLAEYNS